MRILHTSDWHLGRSFHGHSLLDDQVMVVESMADMVRSESVDVVVIAGDIYDRAIPAADAVEALSHLLITIRDAGAAVVAIAGNHDSASRLCFAEPLLSVGGVHLRGDITRTGEPVVIVASDDGPDVAFYLVPYLEPEVARHRLGTPDLRSHGGLLDVALDPCRHDRSARKTKSVGVAHTFVTHGETSESERDLSVGGIDPVPLSVVEGFDYFALGHLHGRQALAPNVRYSGSPLAYSFSEERHRKGAWMVDIGHDVTSVTAVDVPVPRMLKTIRGSLDDLLADRQLRSFQDRWIRAQLTDAVIPKDAMVRLQRRFPYAVHLEPMARDIGPRARSYRDRVRGRTDFELINQFITEMTGQDLDESQHAIVSSVMATVTSHEPAA